jgi:dihydropteroate synthase
VDQALIHAGRMRDAGAAIIDVGGESTRPGAKPVSLAEELGRVIPVIKALCSEGHDVSIDTSKAEVMRQAIAAGACMVNDVTSLTGDPASLQVVSRAGVEVCLMHMRGMPATMQQDVHYEDAVSEVEAYFMQRIAACVAAGIDESLIILDPGIGFGKRLEHNLAMIAAIPRFKRMGFPILMGVSRKSFLGAITGAPVEDREIETAAAATACILGGTDMVRLHDVGKQARTVKVAGAIHRALQHQSA